MPRRALKRCRLAQLTASSQVHQPLTCRARLRGSPCGSAARLSRSLHACKHLTTPCMHERQTCSRKACSSASQQLHVARMQRRGNCADLAMAAVGRELALCCTQFTKLSEALLAALGPQLFPPQRAIRVLLAFGSAVARPKEVYELRFSAHADSAASAMRERAIAP